MHSIPLAHGRTDGSLPSHDDGDVRSRIDRIVLIPGLMEPRTLMFPMCFRLRRFRKHVSIWHDRYVFRNTEASISRLAELISDDKSAERIGIVTHSFGDWIARQAIARTQNHRVGGLVSIAPVIGCGFIPKIMHCLGGDLIPEIAIIANPEKAMASLQCDPKVKRMVIWAQIDLGVRRVDLSHLPDVDVRCVPATHMSVVMQPNVISIVERFLFGDEMPTRQ
ncbi:esterase/lipase family protein [Rhodopirellula sp. SWK7]|uniref:esterase/lipase family protein n=1 Tax=Rhodopirellula sp. SWK7 TaxID=595460 RepID=UPI0002BEDBDF|nr:alpha/beta hydrolase [Rhodopirellula sp. SWK7]EMI43021.1 hypothetical protein RRSWK_04515 [Rhodopirellula sp. SWK7]